MGTPDFAVPALNALHKSIHEVMFVVTQPDRPVGRGRKLRPPPVKETSVNLGYEVIQPESVRTDEFADRIKEANPDLFVVVAFGHILTEKILALPQIGAVNIHASLLPKYRGAAPIQWAVISREKETGVTTMLMDAGMDTGDILLSEKIGIDPDDTSGSLHDRLSVTGADVLIKTLKNFDKIKPVSQDHAHATCAPPLNKKDGHIDWKKPAESLDALIRGVTPWPGAYTFHGDKRLKIFRVKTLATDTGEPPGTVIRGFPDELRIATGEGILSVLEIQGASGKRLLIKDFLRGYEMSPGTVLT
ncbi:MAG: methionyl-tRNA formyltransferase [Desulfobacteraceae bacterium]|nr:methionyl-tRNA formyltransferase [Desulfobacteraceae bacterium]